MKRILQFAIMLLPLPLLLCAQDSPKDTRKPDAPQNVAAPSEQPQRTAYRIDFKLFEVEDGKRINQREFSMIAATTGREYLQSNLRVGTRVPVNTGEKANYIDIGFEGHSRLLEVNGRLTASLGIEITGLAPSEEGGGTHGTTMPVLRSTRLNVESVLVPGKPQIVGSIDDLASKKRMQVEVTATKVD